MFDDLARFEALIPLDPPEVLADLDPGLRIHGDAQLEVWYAPLGRPTAFPEVWILGLTPGWQQARIAYAAAARALRGGASPKEAAQRSKPQVAFAGAMRTNLVSMLDELGLARALRTSSSAELFGSTQLRTGSVLQFPVFLRGQNYSGHGPKPTRHPVLLEMLDAVLARELDSAGNCLIVPLGRAVESCLEYSADKGRLDLKRVLSGFPHPSGANGHRHRQFAAGKADLARRVEEWANGTA